MNKYRAILGQLPKRPDIMKWPESHFLDFFSMVNFLTTPKGIIKLTPDTLKALEDSILPHPPSFKTEVLYRVNQFTTDPSSNPRKFFYKFTTFIRCVGYAIKTNPILITPAMEDVIKNNPRLSWMLATYKDVTTGIGAPITVPDRNDATTIRGKKLPTSTDPQTRFMESLLRLSNMFEVLTKSLSKKDIRGLNAKEKFVILAKIYPMLAEARKFKPNSQVFQQINVYKGGREELEEAILDLPNKWTYLEYKNIMIPRNT